MCKKANQIEKSVLDRSILEDAIFAKMLRDRSEMDSYEYQIYKELLHNMIEHITPPELMVYLRVSPKEAIKRIYKRGRDFEVKNDEQYWYDLNQNYNNFFHEYKWSQLLTIDVDNLDFVNIKSHELHILEQINKKLYFNNNKNKSNEIYIKN
jgi:deoxyadenosine/deoxycytidine kinase